MIEVLDNHGVTSLDMHIQVKKLWEKLEKPSINSSTLPIYVETSMYTFLRKRNEAAHHYDRGPRSSWSYKLGHAHSGQKIMGKT